MSTWTHVAGCIRIDSIPCMIDITNEVRDCFKSCDFDSTKDLWDSCNMPCGSEGSVQWYLWVNPDTYDCCSHMITLYGDLRDYGKEQEEEIKNWWNKLLQTLSNIRGFCGVRNAVLQIVFEDCKESLVLDKSFMLEKTE